MANTFLSNYNAWFALGLWHASTWTATIAADGAFFKITMTQGATNVVLKDDDLSSGATAPTVANFMASWGSGSPDGVNLQNAVTTVMTTPDFIVMLNSVGNAWNAITAMSAHTTPASYNIRGGSSHVISGGSYELIYTCFCFGDNTAGAPVHVGHAQAAGRLSGVGSIPFFTPGGQTTIAGYTEVVGNWGRLGMIVPDLGVSDDVVYIVAPGKACSEFQKKGTFPAPTLYPLTWLLGAFDSYYFCPESRCMLYLQASEM
jgi:hypothetical protein